jgi:pilus assembly protein Flp/PilA
MGAIRRTLRRLYDQSGATAVEYGILVSLIAAAIIVAVALLGAQTNGEFQCAGQSILTKVSAC